MPRTSLDSDYILGETYPGAGYDADEEEFLKGMERLRRVFRIAIPSYRDAIELLVTLGYRKKGMEKWKPANSMNGVPEKEFLLAKAAIARFKKLNSRPFPTWTEVLGVLKGCGWKKGNQSSNSSTA